MASAADITQVRLNVNEPTNAAPYTDEALASLIDANGVDATSASIWEAKAASVAHLVSISEGGSSRSMEQIHSNYLEMADRYKTRTVDQTKRTSTTTRPITRY